MVLLEDLNLDAPKTKEFISFLNNLSLSGKKTLVVLGESDKNIYLSSRNLQKVRW